MGTFLFQQFPCLAFTSQWPIQQQVMPWHIRMRPIWKGCADTNCIMKHSTETNHGRQDDLRGNTGTRCGTCTGARKWPGGSFDPRYQVLQSLLLLVSCKTEQIRLDTQIPKRFLLLILFECFLFFFVQCLLAQRGSRPCDFKELTNTTNYTIQMKGTWVLRDVVTGKTVKAPTFPVCCIHRE